MSQVIVNVTLPIVVAKIETVLQDSSSPYHGVTPNTADLRQRLTAYVLRRLPVIYVTLDQDTIQRMGTPSQCYSYEQHRHIDRLIQQGIQTFLNDDPGYVEVPYAAHDDDDPAVAYANASRAQEAMTVSDWFG